MVFEKVKKMIVQELKVPESAVTPEARLQEDLKADSANVMMLVMDIEQDFDITVEDDAITTVKTVEDLVRYIELGAIDGIHIKLIKCGGIYNAVRLMHLAEAHEIQYMIGGMDEGMMAVAAAVQCAAVANTQLFEVHGHLRIAEDPTTGLEAEGSVVKVPDGPGLGVQIAEEKLTQVFQC